MKSILESLHTIAWDLEFRVAMKGQGDGKSVNMIGRLQEGKERSLPLRVAVELLPAHATSVPEQSLPNLSPRLIPNARIFRIGKQQPDDLEIRGRIIEAVISRDP